MLTKYYLISDATNNLWYIENHTVPMSDRWSHNILEAYRYNSYELAFGELDADVFPTTEFRIIEIIVKTE